MNKVRQIIERLACYVSEDSNETSEIILHAVEKRLENIESGDLSFMPLDVIIEHVELRKAEINDALRWMDKPIGDTS